MPIWAAAPSGDAIGSGILERSLSHGRRDADGETGLMREPQGVGKAAQQGWETINMGGIRDTERLARYQARYGEFY